MTVADHLRVELLGPQHDRAGFASGSAPLDEYFHRRAGQDRRRRCRRRPRRHRGAGGPVVGYYTLSAAVLAAADLPDAVARRLPRYPDLPALLLGRLAVDRGYQGQGGGEALLLDALARCYHLRERVGVVAVVVDTIDDRAAGFYARFGFAAIAGQPLRLFLPMPTIGALGLPAPG